MITDAEFGTIEFIRSERAKHIRVRILSTGLRVSLPHKATQEDAMCFIRSIRSKIIAKQILAGKALQKDTILINETTHLQTLTFRVEAKPGARTNINFSLKNDLLSIEFPHGTNCSSNQTQIYFWNGINFFLRKEAKRLLPERTRQLAEKFGFSFSTVKIQSSKSRWGSCSRSQSLNFSFHLLLLPSHLIDYVILHELCHTKEMNHGINFWRWMDRVTNDKNNELREELKKYHMSN